MYSLTKVCSDPSTERAVRRTPSIEDKMSASSDDPRKRGKETGGICRSNDHLCLSVANVFHDLVNAARFIKGRRGWSVCGFVGSLGEGSGLKIVWEPEDLKIPPPYFALLVCFASWNEFFGGFCSG